MVITYKYENYHISTNLNLIKKKIKVQKMTDIAGTLRVKQPIKDKFDSNKRRAEYVLDKNFTLTEQLKFMNFIFDQLDDAQIIGYYKIMEEVEGNNP
jgi:hypothetical protein